MFPTDTLLGLLYKFAHFDAVRGLQLNEFNSWFSLPLTVVHFWVGKWDFECECTPPQSQRTAELRVLIENESSTARHEHLLSSRSENRAWDPVL